MIGCLRTCVRKQPIIALYFEFETVLMFYNLKARTPGRGVAIYMRQYIGGVYLLSKLDQWLAQAE